MRTNAHEMENKQIWKQEVTWRAIWRQQKYGQNISCININQNLQRDVSKNGPS